MTTIDTAALEAARPITCAVRAWIRASLFALDLPAATLGRAIGLHPNTIGDFLRQPGRDIHLETAHGIACELHRRAAAADVALPPLEVNFNGA